ncbi:uncharacterized protein V6R79_014256 [Siganus canaliculatus]
MKRVSVHLRSLMRYRIKTIKQRSVERVLISILMLKFSADSSCGNMSQRVQLEQRSHSLTANVKQHKYKITSPSISALSWMTNQKPHAVTLLLSFVGTCFHSV